MFKSLNIVGRKQEEVAPSMVNELPVKLRMPIGFKGQTVPASIVMMELLWQQYGLDLMHPEVSRWLEQHAPEVKSEVVNNLSANSAQFAVGPKGTIELQLSLKVDDRLREISSQYILSQAGHSMESEYQLRLAA